jgi:hypothetical protein
MVATEHRFHTEVVQSVVNHNTSFCIYTSTSTFTKYSPSSTEKNYSCLCLTEGINKRQGIHMCRDCVKGGLSGYHTLQGDNSLKSVSYSNVLII